MEIKQLCDLTREFDKNIITLKIKNSDLNFYSYQWKIDSLLVEISNLEMRQIEITKLILKVAPSVSF